MIEILKKTRIFLKKFKINEWSKRISNNKNHNIIKKEIRIILNLLAGMCVILCIFLQNICGINTFLLSTSLQTDVLYVQLRSIPHFKYDFLN
jgi:hypothetical protein